MPTARSPRKTPKAVTIRDLDRDRDVTISFTRTPEVLVRSFPHPARPQVLVYRQGKRTKVRCQGTTDQGPNVTWLFFGPTCLVGIVKLDGLPLRFESKQTCRDVWPTELTFLKTRAGRTGPSLRAKMCNGTAINYSPWSPTVVHLDDSLWGTDMFWDPLDAEHTEFTADELKAIRQIAERDRRPESAPTGKAKPAELHPGVLYAFDDFTRLKTTDGEYTLSRQLPRKAIDVLFTVHPSKVERKSWFNTVYTKLNRPTPVYERWKPTDWFTGENDERRVYDELIDHHARLFGFNPCITGVEIH